MSILGYPVATDIRAPWAAVHAVIPLAVPGAVGVATLARRVRASIRRTRNRSGDDGGRVSRAWTLPTAMAVLLLCGAAVGAVGANAMYANSTDDDEAGQIIQWAQPENDLKETLGLVRGVVRVTDGTDVVFVGTHTPGNPSDVRFYVEDEGSLRQPRPGGPSWHTRLPLPWYLERYGANVTAHRRTTRHWGRIPRPSSSRPVGTPTRWVDSSRGTPATATTSGSGATKSWCSSTTTPSNGRASRVRRLIPSAVIDSK
ncbi:hypothetical protein ACFQL0_11690 [Haloplanus litoreus]|uniref:hypothetical protein n=1 Tax=Haloplanus litoreus TaxID=767515 RepID=UPI003624141C